MTDRLTPEEERARLFSLRRNICRAMVHAIEEGCSPLRAWQAVQGLLAELEHQAGRDRRVEVLDLLLEDA